MFIPCLLFEFNFQLLASVEMTGELFRLHHHVFCMFSHTHHLQILILQPVEASKQQNYIITLF